MRCHVIRDNASAAVIRSGMQNGLPPQLAIPADMAYELVDAAVRIASDAIKRKLRPPQRRGQTLRPGLDTPLWNALAAAILAKFRRRGERARLARVLRLPRQRVTEMLRNRRHLPDAERTLMLLLWLHARNTGGDLA